MLLRVIRPVSDVKFLSYQIQRIDNLDEIQLRLKRDLTLTGLQVIVFQLLGEYRIIKLSLRNEEGDHS
jgi:hypothetical protein